MHGATKMCVCVYIYIYMCVCVCVCGVCGVCVCVYIYIYMCVCVCGVCVCVCVVCGVCVCVWCIINFFRHRFPTQPDCELSGLKLVRAAFGNKLNVRWRSDSDLLVNLLSV